MLWQNLREEEFEEAVRKSEGVCVIPIGSLEKHGQHLPVGTDAIKAEAIVRLAAEKEPVVVFPTFWFGDVAGLYKYKGSVILSPNLMVSLLEELCDEIGRNGFKKIVLCNSHGGNRNFLGFAGRQALYKKKDYVTYTAHIGLPLPADLLAGLEDGSLKTPLSEKDRKILEEYAAPDVVVGHACIAETMFLMGVAPELVRLDRADDSGLGVYKDGALRMDHLKDLQCPFTWHANFPNHYQGTNPGKCTPQMGELAKEYMLNRVISFIQAAKKDEEALKISDEMEIPKR